MPFLRPALWGDYGRVDKTYLHDGHGFWKRVAALLAWCAGGASVHFTSVFFVTTISPLSPAPFSAFACVCVFEVAFAIPAGSRTETVGILMESGEEEL